MNGYYTEPDDYNVRDLVKDYHITVEQAQQLLDAINLIWLCNKDTKLSIIRSAAVLLQNGIEIEKVIILYRGIAAGLEMSEYRKALFGG